MGESSDPVPKMAVLLASGTAERLLTASTLVSGAAALGYEVTVFASYWGLDALRASGSEGHPPVEAGHGADAQRLEQTLRDRKVPTWRQILRTAKALGNVKVFACSQSMEVLGLHRTDLDPLVDEVLGITSFVDRTRGSEATYFV